MSSSISQLEEAVFQNMVPQLEAAARSLVPAKFGKAQTPARLLEALAFEGYITPDEADILREIGKIRNEVAHGRLDLMPTRKQVESLVGITRAILQLTE